MSMRRRPRVGGKADRENEAAPSPSGEVCAATCRAVAKSGNAATIMIALIRFRDIPTSQPSPFRPRPDGVHYNYGRSYIRSAGLAARQGALARRNRNLCRGGGLRLFGGL